MGFRINTNVPALSAQKSLEQTSNAQEKALNRLSSGQRIVSAGDDPAGLAIGSNLNAQIRGMNQAKRSANDGISLVQTAEGGVNEISNMLIRLRELGVQAASDTIGEKERELVNLEATELKSEIDRIASTTEYNGIKILSGENDNPEMHFQVGPNSSEDNRIMFDANAMKATAGELGIEGIDLSERDSAAESLDAVDSALATLNKSRAGLGAVQNRLMSTRTNLSNMIEQFSSAKSRVLDVDYAEEASELVRANILASAGTAVLSQASSRPSQALKLL